VIISDNLSSSIMLRDSQKCRAARRIVEVSSKLPLEGRLLIANPARRVEWSVHRRDLRRPYWFGVAVLSVAA